MARVQRTRVSDGPLCPRQDLSALRGLGRGSGSDQCSPVSLAIHHLRDQGKIVLKTDLEGLFSGFPWGLPDHHQAEEIAREHMQKYDVSRPLKELLFAVLLVEITSSLLSEKKLIWLAPPGDRP